MLHVSMCRYIYRYLSRPAVLFLSVFFLVFSVIGTTRLVDNKQVPIALILDPHLDPRLSLLPATPSLYISLPLSPRIPPSLTHLPAIFGSVLILSLIHILTLPTTPYV